MVCYVHYSVLSIPVIYVQMFYKTAFIDDILESAIYNNKEDETVYRFCTNDYWIGIFIYTE